MREEEAAIDKGLRLWCCTGDLFIDKKANLFSRPGQARQTCKRSPINWWAFLPWVL